MREISRERAAARARARRALRACDADAEYAGVRVVRGADFGAEAVAAAEEDFLRVVFCAASVVSGRQTAIPSSRAQIRATDTGRIRRTNPPRCGRQRLAGVQPMQCNSWNRKSLATKAPVWQPFV